jgi:hypothetical protein
MSAFTHTRLNRMRRAGPGSTAVSLYGDIKFALRDSTATVQLHVWDGRLEIGGSEAPRVTLAADDAGWGSYLARTGGVEAGHLLLMALGGALSDGELPTPLTIEGDQRALFAYAPVIDALLESARDPKEVSA